MLIIFELELDESGVMKHFPLDFSHYKMYYSYFKRFDGIMNWKTSHGNMFDLSSRGSNNSDASSDEYVCVITPSSSFSYEKRFILSF